MRRARALNVRDRRLACPLTRRGAGSELIQIDDAVRRVAGGALNVLQQALGGGFGGGERLFDFVHGGVIVGRDRFNTGSARADELNELTGRRRR